MCLILENTLETLYKAALIWPVYLKTHHQGHRLASSIVHVQKLEIMLFSTALFFSAFIFMVVATPTPAFTVEKRQGDRQIILTLAPNYLVTLDQSHPDVIGGSQ